MYPPFGPILFQLGPLSLHWYGVIMVAAIVVAASVASMYISSRGQDGSKVWDMLLWILIPALIGERLYYVFIQAPRSGPNGLGSYLANPITILEIWNGGMHIYGAFIFGGIALALYAYWKKPPLLIFLDGVGLALLLGQAIGRWANFINQELYGPPTTLPWGLRIDALHRIAPYNNMALYPDSVRFQPLFLYELLANLLGFILIFWIAGRFKNRLHNGDLFLLYLIWYPLVRFCLEFMRTDSWFFPGTPFNVVHLLSAITIISAATILIVRHRRPLAIVEDDDGEDDNGDEDVDKEEAPPDVEEVTLNENEVGEISEANEDGEVAKPQTTLQSSESLEDEEHTQEERTQGEPVAEVERVEG